MLSIKYLHRLLAISAGLSLRTSSGNGRLFNICFFIALNNITF